MSFKLLKQVIAHLRQKSICPYCKSRFNDDSIFILATSTTTDAAACNGIFFVVCPKCNASAFVAVEVSSITQKLKNQHIKMETTATPDGISTNEVLDMHNFLKSWEGDVSELFKQ